MGKRVITVSREFGSGGREVGRLLANSLGIAFYDKELLARIAEKSGLEPSYIQEFGEYAISASGLFHNLNFQAGLPGADIPIPDRLYLFQHDTIRELAEQEPCVIVGRCADHVLRDRNDCLHLFLHADAAFRIDRIVRIYGESNAEPARLLEETDCKRKTYYKHYTNRIWGMAQNYHVTLNSGVIGVEKCAEVAAELAKQA